MAIPQPINDCSPSALERATCENLMKSTSDHHFSDHQRSGHHHIDQQQAHQYSKPYVTQHTQPSKTVSSHQRVAFFSCDLDTSHPGDSGHKVGCNSWERFESPDSSLKASRRILQNVTKTSRVGEKDNHNLCNEFDLDKTCSVYAPFQCWRYFPEIFAEQNGFSICSARHVYSDRLNQQAETESRVDCGSHHHEVRCSHVQQMLHIGEEELQSGWTRACQHDIRQAQTFHHVLNWSYSLKLNYSANLWVDLHKSSAWSGHRCTVVSELVQLLSACIHRTFSVSRARTWLVYLLVLSILAHTGCEAGVLPQHKTNLHVSPEKSLTFRQARLSLPFVHHRLQRRRRSASDGSPLPLNSLPDVTQSNSSFPSPLSPDSDPKFLSPSTSSSLSSASPTSSSSVSHAPPNIPHPLISNHTPSLAEFELPHQMTAPELVLLLSATLQQLDVTRDRNLTAFRRCFRIKKVSSTTSPAQKPPASASSSEKPSELPESVETSLVIEELYIHRKTDDTSSSSSSSSNDDKSQNYNNNDDNGHNNNSNNKNSSMYDVVCLKENTVKSVILGHERTTPPQAKKGFLHSGKLSRTQIVVISTCSAIIGMFFLIAAFLRIRNYIKRIRLEQALANRPKFRSCSVALRNPASSMEQLRRDSLASKVSHQNSVTTKGSNYSHTREDDSSASSPRHDPDTTPLLVITRAPPGGGADPGNPSALTPIGAGDIAGRGGANGGPASSASSAGIKRLGDVDTPTHSDSSLQYIDEEKGVPRKKAPLTSSLVKNSSGNGGGYTICMNHKGHHSKSRSPERPGSLPTGRDVSRNGRGQGRTETSPGPRRLPHRNVPGGRREERSGSYFQGGVPDASPTALLSPARSSVDGNINPSFSSGTISLCSPSGQEAGKTYASDPCVARSKGGPSTPVEEVRRVSLHSSQSARSSPRALRLVRAASTGKPRAGVLKPGSIRGERTLSVDVKAIVERPTDTRSLAHNGDANPVQASKSGPESEVVSLLGAQNKTTSDLSQATNEVGGKDHSTTEDIRDSKSREQCGFGLTQSDTSICSSSNQGREFSGQREYCPDMDSPEVDFDLMVSDQDSPAEVTDHHMSLNKRPGLSNHGDPQISITDTSVSLEKETLDCTSSGLLSHRDIPSCSMKNLNSHSFDPNGHEMCNHRSCSKGDAEANSEKYAHAETRSSLDSPTEQTGSISKTKTENFLENTGHISPTAPTTAETTTLDSETRAEVTNKNQLTKRDTVLEVSHLKLLPDPLGQSSVSDEPDNNNTKEKNIFSVSNGTPKQAVAEKNVSPMHRINGTD